jgi:signal transduction histidine kinase
VNLPLAYFVVASLALLTSIILYRANPRRPLNISVGILFALTALYLLVMASLLYVSAPTVPIQWASSFLFRVTNSISSFFPFSLWLILRSAAKPETAFRDIFNPRLLGLYLLIGTSLFSALCYTNHFIPPENSATNHVYGWGYHMRIYSGVFFGGALLLSGIREWRKAVGIQRSEILLLGLMLTSTFIIANLANYAARFLGYPQIRHVGPLSTLVFVGVAAWGVTQRKILDAREIIISISAYGGIFIASLLVLFCAQWLQDFTNGSAWASAAILNFAIVIYGHKRAMHYLHNFDHEAVEQTRSKLLSLSQDLSSVRVIEHGCAILRAWGRSPHAMVFIARDDALVSTAGAGVSETLHAALRDMGQWASPERLLRERSSTEVQALSVFMTQHDIGLMVTCPAPFGEKPIIVALSRRLTLRPFTFSDSERLREWAGLIYTSLSRALLSEKTRHAERLATMGFLGAGFAHEIRNALSPIKAFFSVGMEVGAFRGEMTALAPVAARETDRIETMVSQMLLITHPRNLHLLRADAGSVATRCIEQQRPKAEKAGVSLILSLPSAPLFVMADKSLDQVLINLLSNAIEATATNRTGDVREVRISLRALDSMVEIAVSDTGPGIAASVRDQLFQPFVTGKSSGAGLGLMLSRRLAEGHSGTLTLEPSDRGALFLLRLPRQT